MNKKLTLLFFCLFIANQSFSQGLKYYFTPSIEFTANNTTYYADTKGLQKFLDETPMDSELKNELTEKLNVFKKKKKTTQIVGFSLAGAGLGYLLIASSKNKKGEGMKSSDAFTGFGIVCSAVVFDIAFGNKRKDYQQFLETYNQKTKSNPVRITTSINFDTHLSTGLAVTF